MSYADRVQALLDVVLERARQVRSPWRRKAPATPRGTAADVIALARQLLSERSQSSGIGLARQILDLYHDLDKAERLTLFLSLADDFGPDPDAIEAALTAYRLAPAQRRLSAVTRAAEPPRQELLRRLNQPTAATAELVQIRADLQPLIAKRPELGPLDEDMVHLLRSWFNRGFLVLRRVDWSSPADFLERVIRYEAVHSIGTWAELRERLQPMDRRCYAFMHPAMPDEPLIFVEVALTDVVPSSIQRLLDPARVKLPPAEARVAVFYSISNCQTGLAGISFGQFLIKQVVQELSSEFAGLETFVTLSPVPGFRRWLESNAAAGDAEASKALAADIPPGLPKSDPRAVQRLALATRYMLTARDRKGRPVDSVARFHLGNGAGIERLCWMGDTSQKGMTQADGLMVNYLYDLAALEENHDAFVQRNIIAASPALSRGLRVAPTPA